MKTQVVFFPFDLFGAPGTRAGAELLADAFREMLDDNRRERVPTRARAYMGKVTAEEWTFDALPDYQDWRGKARAAARPILARGDTLFWISGNHLGVLPVLEELGRLDRPPLVVQLDAHLDIYNLSDCTSELSNGNFLLHAEGALPPLINVGHRELLLKRDYCAGHFRHAFPAAELAVDLGPALTALRDASREAGAVFVDVDCDVFDPAYCPAVAQPQPFGVSPHMLLRVLDAVASVPLAGLALSEFDPSRDERDRSLALLMWLLEFVLLRLYEQPKGASK